MNGYIKHGYCVNPIRWDSILKRERPSHYVIPLFKNCAELTVNPVNNVVLLGKQLPLWHLKNWAVKRHH